jgi:translation initiation factor IF-2
MKTILILLLAVFIWGTTTAQTTTKKKTTTTTKSKTTAKKTAPAAYGKEIQVTLKNMAEGSVAIFAGPKEDLRETTKRKTVGGLSKNTLYVRVNEVVCIVKGDKTVSCAAIKATTTQLEINSSANQITVK